MSESPQVTRRVGSLEHEEDQTPLGLFALLRSQHDEDDVWTDRFSWRDLFPPAHRTPRSQSAESEDYILSVISDATPFQGLLRAALPQRELRRPSINVYIVGLGSIGHVTGTPILAGEKAHRDAPPLVEEPWPVRAVRELCEWLDLPEAGVADIADFAVRSVANWRAGRQPYPATVRRLYQIHAFVTSLVKSLGSDRARLWMNEPQTRGGAKRLYLLKTDEGLASVMDETSSLIFERPRPVEPLAAEFEERQVEQQFRRPPHPDLMRPSPPDDADEAE